MKKEKRTVQGVCLCISLILCVLEGAVRKWIIRDSDAYSQAICYFSKDAFLLIAFIYSSTKQVKVNKIYFNISHLLVLSFVFISIGTVINYDGFAPLGALLTLRNILWLPFVSLVVGVNLNNIDIKYICYTILFLTAINSILGVLQFLMPQDHLLNYTTKSDVLGIFDVGRVRASGTFAFITGMSCICIFSTWSGLLLILKNKGNIYGYISIGAGFVCCLCSISRSGVLYSIVLILFVVFYTKRGFFISLFFLPIVIFAYLNGNDINTDNIQENDPTIGSAIFIRHSKSDSVFERVSWMMLDAPIAITYYPLGTGLGRGQTGQQAADNSDYAFVFEVELSRIIYEIGIFGFMAAVIYRIGLLILFWRHWHNFSVKFKIEYEYILIPSIVFFALMISMNICFDHILSTFSCIICAVTISSCKSY